LVSVWASVTKFEMIRRAWASHALLYNTPINREGGGICTMGHVWGASRGVHGCIIVVVLAGTWVWSRAAAWGL
jgi:hypothetical protein